MGLLGDGFNWIKDKTLDFGAAIISAIFVTLFHYIYIFGVYVANSLKSKKRISDCLIKVLEDLDLFPNNVDLNRVRIIENAIGLKGLGLTNKYTIYISTSFDEINDLWLFLHELKHVEQYANLGYVVFVSTYDYQLVRYGYEDAPLEIAASKFATDNEKTVDDKYDADCRPVTDPDSPVFKQMIIDEDWTMLLDLI